MHIYAFGSVCRGDVDQGSDIDLLAIVNGFDGRFDPNIYSVYSYQRLEEIWSEGNPFAWHLSLESKLLYSETDTDFFEILGTPANYQNGKEDCNKFYQIFLKARESFSDSVGCQVFDLSTMFLSIRNFATCFSLAFAKDPVFSRNSARQLGSLSVPISTEIYDIFVDARLLCTRAIGRPPSQSELSLVTDQFEQIEAWMVKLGNTAG